MNQRLNPIDEVFLSMDGEVGLAHGQFLRFCGSPPPLKELHDHLAERLPDLPGLSHRMTPSPGRPRRELVSGFDPAAHLGEERFPAGTPLDTVLTAMAREPLPRNAPLWSIRLVHGYADGEFAVCYRVHHSTEDGMGAAHIVSTLFGDGGSPAGKRRAAGSRPLISGSARELARGTLSVGMGLARALVPARRWPRAPKPLPERLGVAGAGATWNEMRELSRRFGGTLNDAFLMTLWQALDDWSAGGDDGVRSLFHTAPVPVRMPLSTRRTGEDALLGNHLTTAVVTLPARGTPFDVAFGQLAERTRRMRAHGLRPASRALVGILPPAVTRWTVRRLLSPHASPLYASNFSLPTGLSFRGAPAIDVTPLGVLLPGNALSVTLLSYGQQVRISFLYDRALPEAERLAGLWREALDALSVSAGPGPLR
ncbi:wax ester/triacylglycerol synthase domain-containing protein [Streptomyces sp. S.PB5]|uniref:wax ester/triacylglycerol synthase domain-containing protein n=1 Tax=Streptomyces sp. S.PB5 TaxID=3020844 RepID=UPI0025B2744A|nr:wax ester/triacylglycerol synthase domain-containing protein [Streptomyces sp. S.PB5]MDN3028377.1 wax ester/triacylglycerol synthase family O-acyltransferase [Streptomyces sp. S.PB5]